MNNNSKKEYIWFVQIYSNDDEIFLDYYGNGKIVEPFKIIGYRIGHQYGYQIDRYKNKKLCKLTTHVESIKANILYSEKNYDTKKYIQPISIQPDGRGKVHICKYINDGHRHYSLTASSINYLFKIMIKRWRNRKHKQLVKNILHKNKTLIIYDGDNSITNHILEYVTIF